MYFISTQIKFGLLFNLTLNLFIVVYLSVIKFIRLLNSSNKPKLLYKRTSISVTLESVISALLCHVLKRSLKWRLIWKKPN